MAVTLSANKSTSVTCHVASANATIKVAGNNSVSNIGVPLSTDTVSGAKITQVAWGNDGVGYITVKRNGKTILVLDSTGYIDFQGAMPLDDQLDKDIVVACNGGADFFISMKLQKSGTFESNKG